MNDLKREPFCRFQSTQELSSRRHVRLPRMRVKFSDGSISRPCPLLGPVLPASMAMRAAHLGLLELGEAQGQDSVVRDGDGGVQVALLDLVGADDAPAEVLVDVTRPDVPAAARRFKAFRQRGKAEEARAHHSHAADLPRQGLPGQR